ncbi:MAG: hypothetical protein AAF995_06840 [Planctomycetota bacterium]
MHNTAPRVLVLLSSSAVLFAASCAEEEPLPPPPPPSPELLDDAPASPAQPAPPQAQPRPADTREPEAVGNPVAERELVEQRRSQSTLGRSRDTARDLRNDIVGGADRDDAVAATTADEHYLEAANLVWDVPLDWAITIPSDASILSSARITSPTGDANIRVAASNAPAQTVVRNWRRDWVDMTGDAANIRTERTTINNTPVTLASAEGTYTAGRGNEQPFWALRAAIVERPGQPPIVLTLIGPEDTVRRADAQWRALIQSQRQR